MNLTPRWKEGVFDRLAAGEVPGEELGQPQKAAASGSSGKAWMSPCALSDMRI